MDDYQKTRCFGACMLSDQLRDMTACDLNPYWLPTQIWYEFSSPLSRWPVSSELWSTLRCHHITQKSAKGMWK